ncbi:hypothetical protein FKM82_014437 [Ascaphus truei]
MSGSKKALAKGSPAPGPVPEGLIRLYSMRFCPFAQRSRLVLAAKGIRFEEININLQNKPDWFFDKSPFGLVPVLETSKGQLIYDSPIVSEYLDEAFPGKKLIPADPYQRAHQRMVVEHFSWLPTLLYKMLTARTNNEDTAKLKAEFLEKIIKFDEFLGKLNTPYFGGDAVSMADYMVWPWFERFIFYDVQDCLNKTPHINSWFQLMMKDPAVKATYTEPAVLEGFYKLYSQKSKDAGDYGL